MADATENRGEERGRRSLPAGSTVIVTGGAGFIGSALVRRLLADTDHRVVTLDKLTYAGHKASLDEVLDDARHVFVEGDIADEGLVRRVFEEFRPAAVMHLAAETHVDRSIDGPLAFVRTNVLGTVVLLDEARRHLRSLPAVEQSSFRFVHVSTDEVFGSLGSKGRFDEDTPYDPRSPYSASKAGSDHLAKSYFHTYGMPVIVTNCSNNYGPRQFPEKLIPTVILKALRGEGIPVYGTGENVRDWLHVDDHARGLIRALQVGRAGETYAFGGDNELRNIDLVERICSVIDVVAPAEQRHREKIAFVTDRPGHDRRYAIDASKARRELGWAPTVGFEDGLRRTVRWYVEHPQWVETVLTDRYDLQRQGAPS